MEATPNCSAFSRRPPSVVKAGYWFVGSDRLPVADIPSQLFTYLYAGFAKVNPDTGSVTFPNQYKQQFESFTTIVRRRNPVVKTLLSIGGDIDKYAANHISLVMKDQCKRTRFIQDSIYLARSFHFDGLDLCWLYPSSSDNDADLDSFLNEWKAAVDQEAKDTTKVPLLLTAAVYYDPVVDISGGTFSYPCDTINGTLNWINVLSIDFYTPSNSSRNTGPVHAWSTRPEDPNRCGKDGIANWIDSGVSSNKLVLSLPFYGYEWNLLNANSSGFFASAHPASPNLMTYRNIKPKLIEYVLEYNPKYIAPYAHNYKKSWIGYEDECSIRGKVTAAIRGNNLGGYSAWHVGADDKNWTLSAAAFKAMS